MNSSLRANRAGSTDALPHSAGSSQPMPGVELTTTVMLGSTSNRHRPSDRESASTKLRSPETRVCSPPKSGPTLTRPNRALSHSSAHARSRVRKRSSEYSDVIPGLRWRRSAAGRRRQAVGAQRHTVPAAGRLGLAILVDDHEPGRAGGGVGEQFHPVPVDGRHPGAG